MTGFTPHAQRIDRDRVISAVGVAIVHAALGWALLTGLGVSIPDKAQEALAAFDVTDPPPPPPVPPPNPPRPAHERAPRKEGAAAPPNLKSRATEVTAPVTPIPIPPPVVVTPLPGPGADATSGNAARIGPGTGSGGFGTGTGSGRYGDGPGGGGAGGRPLRWLSGRINDSDYPMSALRAEASGSVGLRFVVGVDGRVTRCDVTRSSGNRALDTTTCALIQQRFRYRPATDRDGRPHPDVVTGEHVWELHQRTVYGRDDDDEEDDGY